MAEFMRHPAEPPGNCGLILSLCVCRLKADHAGVHLCYECGDMWDEFGNRYFEGAHHDGV